MSSEAPEVTGASGVTGPVVVRLRGVSKIYDRAPGRGGWRAAIPGLPERPRVPHAAIADLDLEVRRGEAVGLIGPNGAGKSTVLKLVAGVTRPTGGTIEVDGDVGSMIELGLGFHPDLTGWENALASSLMHGRSRSAARRELPAIGEFAGLGDAMDAPLKSYSLGMRARLAFAVATHADAAVLAVDEVLAVGDRDFQDRCLRRIDEMVRRGTALLFVSHEMALVSHMCARVVHVRDGRIVDDGPVEEVVERYLSQSASRFHRDADPAMRIRSWRVPETIAPLDPVIVTAEVDVTEPVARPAVGVELALPVLFPDSPVASTVDPVPDLSEPGRYRLTGSGRPLGGENARLRLTLSLVDAARHRVCDLVRADSTFVRQGQSDTTPSPVGGMLMLSTTWETSELGPVEVGPRATRRRTSIRPDGAVITLDGVTKQYRPHHGGSRLREAMPWRMDTDVEGAVTALDGVSLTVAPGESVGLIGPNGAGKTTLLRVLAGIVRPDRGDVQVGAEVVPMLDLGAGFHPQLSGVDNVWMAGQLMGMTQQRIAECFDEIVGFADVGDALAAPVKQYSSGMLARLGFALAIHAPGTILLIDELLAVGDEQFRRKAIDAVERRRREGATVLFVSHELRMVEEVCHRVVRLQDGRVIDDGPAPDVIAEYAGLSWAGGVSDATTGVRLRSFDVDRRHVPTGGTLEITGEIEVETPSPTVHLELAYRAVPVDRLAPLSVEERLAMSLYLETVEPAGGILARPGRYRYRCVIDGNQFGGEVDVVVSAIDERDNVILAEVWQEILVGHRRPEGFPGPVLDFTWSVERLSE